MTPSNQDTLSIAEVTAEIKINAPPAKVWKALVGDVTGWWHRGFMTSPDTQSFHIEPKLGGRVFEDWGDGQGLMWGTVIGLRREQFLQAVGDSSAEWGGPSRSIFTWRLAGVGGQTTVRFSQSIFGRVDPATRHSLDQGWRFLFENCLKRLVETGSIAGAGDPPSA